MTYGFGRLQSLMAALSHLLDATGHLMGIQQPADLEIVREVDALAVKVKQRPR